MDNPLDVSALLDEAHNLIQRELWAIVMRPDEWQTVLAWIGDRFMPSEVASVSQLGMIVGLPVFVDPDRTGRWAFVPLAHDSLSGLT